MPAPEQPRELFVLKTAENRTLTISHLPSGALVVDDATARVGVIQGDLTPLVLDVGGKTEIVFAGEVSGGSKAASVCIETLGDQQTCTVAQGVEHGVWMTRPVSFEPGMTVTASWRDQGGNELWRAQSSPLTADRLDPIFGPEWTSYAPL
jgi:hypothetical protein